MRAAQYCKASSQSSSVRCGMWQMWHPWEVVKKSQVVLRRIILLVSARSAVVRVVKCHKDPCIAMIWAEVFVSFSSKAIYIKIEASSAKMLRSLTGFPILYDTWRNLQRLSSRFHRSLRRCTLGPKGALQPQGDTPAWPSQFLAESPTYHSVLKTLSQKPFDESFVSQNIQMHFEQVSLYLKIRPRVKTAE